MLTPQQRRLHAQAMAHAQWAKEPDRKARAWLGTQGFLRRFEREVDPDGRLSPQERATRAEHALRSYMQRLALRSSRARAARKAGGDASA